ncbi:MAG: MFS transporter [Ectothiorhodospiraceae bacterium]|nr:MFS transporter [Ectothiorhodospiraceae bacterium]
MYVYLPAVYAEWLPLATVGVVLLVARAVDLLTDPLIGILGDRLHTPLGRRRGLMVLGLPVLMVGVLGLFLPPSTPTVAHLLGFSLVAYLGWSMVMLPYLAWGAELSEEYHQRTRVTASREAWVILGTLLAVIVPALVDDGAVGVRGLGALGIALAVALPCAVAVAVIWVSEPPAEPPPVLVRGALLREVAANAPFRRLLLAYLLNGTANALPASLFLLYVEHVLGRPDWTGPLLVVYLLAGIAALPLWMRLARRHDKHRVWAWSMLWAAAAFAGVPFVDPDQAWVFAVICALSGASLAVDMALPASIQADVLDVDRANGGARKAGLYYGLWSMATKLALALSVGLAFPALDLAGFDPGSPSPVGVQALALLYGMAPVAIKLVVVALIWRFPLDRAAQRALGERIAQAEDARTARASPMT